MRTNKKQQAKLIAAAPDMLKALELAENILYNNEFGKDTEGYKIWKRCQAAINKAKGLATGKIG